MKKYILFVVAFITIAIAGYLYVYKVHRDIETENEAYHGDVKTLFEAYQADESQSNLEYLDKTIVVSGVISSLQRENRTLVLNKQLHAVINENIHDSINEGDKIKIKGRLIGYDSLLEELKLDQSVIVK
ncbi:hypothetical protein SLW70_14050 [Flavobacterium sp. NG2]|uniref:OB-fold protein n=1 Tax=Flavobacterium sp. NG2 TaxID=3097547 RepID=UPI002A83E436|nr:hypothetical protein [Flavobacterium sp. NG2]WPR71046.1 hypothetical protein SLW70_14050 [Flavobacterium sp. NG2]